MYEAFYGLNEKPFNLNPDPDYLYMSKGHENAFMHLDYAIAESKGFVVVTGEIGSGKTTLVNYLLAKVPEDIHIGLINNTHIPHTQLIKLICREFELEIEKTDHTSMLEAFHDFLLEQFSSRKRVVLIIYEAQNLTPKTLEEIRLLSNLEAEKHHLIQIILLGQPELKYKLQRRDLQQFAQRVTVHCHLGGLSSNEVKSYIHHRLRVAGAKKPNIFDANALKTIAEHSRGIPRMINILCDTALVYGYADSLKSISENIINDVIKERAAGGIFTTSAGEESGEDLDKAPFDLFEDDDELESVHSESGGRPSSEQMQLIENRFKKLSSKISSIDQRLAKLEKTKSDRDTLMLDLFRLLKESMESRLDAILKISKILR
jgi:general secretion pathway protein A